MRPTSPCLGCTSRSELCHGKCKAYGAFKAELEKIKADKDKRIPVEGYFSEQIRRWKQYNFIKTEKRNRKQF